MNASRLTPQAALRLVGHDPGERLVPRYQEGETSTHYGEPTGEHRGDDVRIEGGLYKGHIDDRDSAERRGDGHFEPSRR